MQVPLVAPGASGTFTTIEPATYGFEGCYSSFMQLPDFASGQPF